MNPPECRVCGEPVEYGELCPECADEIDAEQERRAEVARDEGV